MKKMLEGKVISVKMKKTVVVEVERKFRHPVYRKVITRHKKYKAHYENQKLNVGDTVFIEETRPISKEVHFIVLENSKSQKSK